MTFSKLFPVLCTLAVGMLCFTTRAEDNPDQAAARAALAKQLFELSPSTNASATDTSVAMQPVNSDAAKAKAKADKAAAKAKAKQEADQAKADMKTKAEADKKLADQQAADAKATAEQAKAKAKTDKIAADAAAKAQTDQKAATDKAALDAALAARMNAEAQAKNAAQSVTNPPAPAMAASESDSAAKKKKETTTTPVPPPAPKPSPAADNSYVGQDLGMKPIAAPALPISATKVERLQALLEKYKADQLTPDEYHLQRAAILAEP